MSYQILPKRVFKSPMIEYANFSDGTFVNIIRLIKPYANGQSYAVYETTRNPFCSNGMFKTYQEAKEKFDLMVRNQLRSGAVSLSKKGTTVNWKEY